MAPDIALLGLVAILAVALVALWARQRDRLRRLTSALGATDPSQLESAARASRAAAEAGEEARADAERSERELRRLVEIAPAGALLIDDDLVIVSANGLAHETLRRRPGTLVGHSVMEAFADHRVEEIVMAGRDRGGAGGEVVLRDPTHPTLAFTATRVEPGRTWVLFQDVSELRRLERIRTEFVDNLSHELRTPLTTIRLLTETMVREVEDGDVPARLADRIKQIDVESGHLVQMVTELLDLTRIEQDVAPLHLGDVDLGAILSASTVRLALFAERQGVHFSTVVPPGLPGVRGDEERLAQVLANLLHNAVKFSPNGGDVTVSADHVGDEVVVSVADHGIGIPRADLERVFERFYKVDRARVRGGGGTGIGLAIARHIVESHGGRIWVESLEGSGSTFRFALPLTTTPEPAATAP